MKRIVSVTSRLAAIAWVPMAFVPTLGQADGAIPPHAFNLVCSATGTAGTNLLNLYVQAASSDDPIALAAVGTPSQPPPGIECSVALAKLLSLCTTPSPKGAGSKVSAGYVLQTVVGLREGSWIYTLTAPAK